MLSEITIKNNFTHIFTISHDILHYMKSSKQHDPNNQDTSMSYQPENSPAENFEEQKTTDIHRQSMFSEHVLPPFTWSVPTHRHTEKNADWYWAVGIATLSIAVTAIILENYFFAILIIIASVTLSLFGSKPPRIIDVGVDDTGILIDDLFYPFQNLEAFWIDEEEKWGNSLLILRSNRPLSPLISVWIDEETIDIDELRDHLQHFLEAEEMKEPISQRVMEWIGF